MIKILKYYYSQWTNSYQYGQRSDKKIEQLNKESNELKRTVFNITKENNELKRTVFNITNDLNNKNNILSNFSIKNFIKTTKDIIDPTADIVNNIMKDKKEEEKKQRPYL